MALRRPFLHKLLDYEDEFFALLTLLLETHSLRNTGLSLLSTYMLYFLSCFKNSLCPCSDACFSESLYGLRRRAVNVKLKNVNSEASEHIHQSSLQKRQKVLSVAFLVPNSSSIPIAAASAIMLLNSYLVFELIIFCCSFLKLDVFVSCNGSLMI